MMTEAPVQAIERTSPQRHRKGGRSTLAGNLRMAGHGRGRRFDRIRSKSAADLAASGTISCKGLSWGQAAGHACGQPSNFDLVVNLAAAKALELIIPESFLVRADKVIE